MAREPDDLPDPNAAILTLEEVKVTPDGLQVNFGVDWRGIHASTAVVVPDYANLAAAVREARQHIYNMAGALRRAAEEPAVGESSDQ